MKRLRIKHTAHIGLRHFDDEMIPIWRAVLAEWPETTDGCVWCTSGRRKLIPGRNSLHTVDRALDFRTHNCVEKHEEVEMRRIFLNVVAHGVRMRLPTGYDVVSHPELANTPREHIHIEWDPK